MPKPHRIAFVGLAAAAVTLSVAMLVSSLATPVQARIQEADISCANPAGNEPGGQQPSCQNENLTQESENQNPSGAAPPGQNK
jgi:hypothetical protein